MTFEDLADVMLCEGVEYTVLHKCSIHDFEDAKLRLMVTRFKLLHAEIADFVKSRIPEDHEFQTY